MVEDKHVDYEDNQLDRRPSMAVGAGYDDVEAKKLINPLNGIPKEQLLADVDQFCAETGLNDHVDVFRRGALVAQRPDEYEQISELNEEDLHWLRKATTSKWSQPRMLYFTGQSFHLQQ
jgi:hypothetical protein